MDSTNEQNQVITTEEVSESVVTNVEESSSEEKALSRKEKKKQKKALKKEKKLQKKLAKKEKKKRWKETKKEDRRKLKEHYKDAPWFIRIPRLLIGPVFKVLSIATPIILIVAIIGGSIYGCVVLSYMDIAENQNRPVSKEEILEFSPIDEEGAAKIAAMPGIGEDETWTICVYMIGADLEDDYENDLSLTTLYETKKEKDRF